MTRMAPLLRWRKRGNVSAPSPPTFYYRRGTFSFAHVVNRSGRSFQPAILDQHTPQAVLGGPGRGQRRLERGHRLGSVSTISLEARELEFPLHQVEFAFFGAPYPCRKTCTSHPALHQNSTAGRLGFPGLGRLPSSATATIQGQTLVLDSQRTDPTPTAQPHDTGQRSQA